MADSQEEQQPLRGLLGGIVEEFFDLLQANISAVLGLDQCPTVRPQVPVILRRFEDLQRLVGESVDVEEVTQQPGLAISNDLANGSGVTAKHRTPAAEGIKQ